MIPPPSADATDIFSISDQALAERLQFVKEIGFGNWGSVWLCKPKGEDRPEDARVAVKLVHRSKTTTTAARVRSLWNEMKIVRTFKQESHPSIVAFHTFIITPSYALITMDYLPELIPVEIPEPKAKEWLRSLLSGVAFLHKRGVVHNDIKPANILLSTERVPVLVDFGFAEKYDVKGSRAFHSNLTYGTPEYLSPERARGLPHDTRKSDVWALGVTFFEILVGRTPFEQSEGEQFTTKEELEKYWQRTVRGKWVGTWKISRGAERLLKRMVQPNADLRCTAADVLADAYWTHDRATISSVHKRASSAVDSSPSTIFDIISPWTTKTPGSKIAAKESIPPTKLRLQKLDSGASSSARGHGRSQSQSLASSSRAASPKFLERKPSGSLARTRSGLLKTKTNENSNSHGKASLVDSTSSLHQPTRKRLAPIAGSPPATPVSRRGKGNAISGKENAPTGKGHVSRKPTSFISPPSAKVPPKDMKHRRTSALADVTSRAENGANKADTSADRSTGSVRDRMREWERERQRLRAMELDSAPVSRAPTPVQAEDGDSVDTRTGSSGNMHPAAATMNCEPLGVTSSEEPQEYVIKQEVAQGVVVDREVRLPHLTGVREALRRGGAQDNVPTTPVSPDMNFTLFQDTLPTLSLSGSGLSVLGRHFKASIDRSFNLYKTSLSLGFGKQAAQSPPVDDLSLADLQRPKDHEDLNGVVHHAVRPDCAGADNGADRMTLWLQNVEKVVEDARQNFASSSMAQSPPLPLAPSRSTSTRHQSHKSNRLPRKIVAASEIFSGMSTDPIPSLPDRSVPSNSVSSSTSRAPPALTRNITLPTIPSEEPSQSSVFGSPFRPRRATVVGMSPVKAHSTAMDDLADNSPSRKKEKSRSQNDLQRAISPVSRLTLELERLALPQPPESRRLSSLVDRDVFMSTSTSSRAEVEMPRTPATPVIGVSTEALAVPSGLDSLTSSPFDVQPYPPRKPIMEPSLDSPTQRRIEGVYDRFLMATSGVKRVGRGYQSDRTDTLSNSVSSPAAPVKPSSTRLFHSTRRVAMPPPVSSDDVRRANSEDQLSPRHATSPRRLNRSVDELGLLRPSQSTYPINEQKAQPAVRTVRQAFKAIVTGKTVVRKPSRAH